MSIFLQVAFPTLLHKIDNIYQRLGISDLILIGWRTGRRIKWWMLVMVTHLLNIQKKQDRTLLHRTTARQNGVGRRKIFLLTGWAQGCSSPYPPQPHEFVHTLTLVTESHFSIRPSSGLSHWSFRPILCMHLMFHLGVLYVCRTHVNFVRLS
jgi:hypothetical protein